MRARPVILPLKRPIVFKVGLFDQWPLILIDLVTVPETPGSGLAWNEDAVARFAYEN